MNMKRVFRVSALMALIIMLGAFLLIVRYEPVSESNLSERPKSQEMRPIGEITEGFRAEQSINTPSITNRHQSTAMGTVCLELLLANWSNRKNTGEFAVDLLMAGQVFTHVIEAATVVDNAYRKICFENLRVSDLLGADDIRMVLRGISSPPGAAITAWTTTNLSAGQLINMPESLASRSLIFHFVTEQVSEVSYRHAWILVLLSMLALSTLAFTSSSERERRQSGVEDSSA